MTEIRIDNLKAWLAVASFAILVITSAIGGTAWVAGELSGVRASVDALRLELRTNYPSSDAHLELSREVRALEHRVLILEQRVD